MFKRNQIDPFDTINLCNQFLIVYLVKKVASFQSRGLNKNAMVYKNAIYSIKKYPLPIICKAQLESLNGIGQYLSQQLQKVIKSHYSHYLKSDLSPKFPQNQQNQYDNSIKQDSQQSYQPLVEPKGNKPIFISKQQQEDSKSVKSANASYKPRVNTLNAHFLIVLRNLSTERQGDQIKMVSKQSVCKQLQQKFSTYDYKRIKGTQSILLQNGYIKIEKNKSQNSKKQNVYYVLTQKGLFQSNALDKKNKASQTKGKIISEVRTFKSQINTKKIVKSYTQPTLYPEEQNCQKQIPKLQASFLNVQKNQANISKLSLVIDSRQKKQKADNSFFVQKMSKKYGISCKNASLSIGDFLWVYEDKVLDYIVQRKIADDLAISILDGRYKDQKYRLKNCGISNIYYFYQGHPSDNCVKSEKQLYNALLKTRVKQKFKVHQTKDVNQTMNLLNCIHQQIYQKILKNQVKYLCGLDQFIQYNSVQRNSTVEKVFALGLMSIPGVGKNSINTLTEYFKTYRTMYEYLKRFETNDQRIQFLKNLFKGTGIMATLPKIIIELLFSSNYSEINSEINEINQNNKLFKKQEKKEQTYIEERNEMQQSIKLNFCAIKQENQLSEDQFII